MTVRHGEPTPPIEFGGASPLSSRFAVRAEVEDRVLAALRDVAEVVVEPEEVADASRDWWPLAMIWALEDQTPGLATAVVRAGDADQVAAILRICSEAAVPVTTAAGRSGVCGGSAPVLGGILLDITPIAGITNVDETSAVVDVRAGTFGDIYENTLRTEHDLTGGHWPQSIDLSTVGGWLACRGVGQYSTRYGKIEDLVIGLDVVLADGTCITTGGGPRAAVGPDLTQLFVGSEGTLGVITGARLRAFRAPTAEGRAAFGFPTFDSALDAMRKIMQRGATPAVLRLYDDFEAEGNFDVSGTHLLLVHDEGDPVVVDATMRVVAEECASADSHDEALVTRWLEHRNDVSALQPLIRKGYVIDTMEVAAPWSRLAEIYDATTSAVRAVAGTLVCTAHQSHSYGDGGCLYFTFAGKPEPDDRERFYVDAWNAGMAAVLSRGGVLSHHHGVGINRARFMGEALGAGTAPLQGIKDALDPAGILNPGKLGLSSPFGKVNWPTTS